MIQGFSDYLLRPTDPKSTVILDKDASRVYNACAILIFHAEELFSAEDAEVKQRRMSLLRRGERTSMRTLSMSQVLPTPEPDAKSCQQQINQLTATVKDLTEQVNLLKEELAAIKLSLNKSEEKQSEVSES